MASIVPEASLARSLGKGMANGNRLAADAVVGGEAKAPTVQPTVRTKFADTALWVGALTAKAGRATVELTMPENLTTWKARVWVMGAGTRCGEATVEVITTKDLIIRLQAPRFFVQKDEVVLSANVHNYLAKKKKVKVVLELAGGAACIVDEDTDLDDAVSRIIFGAFYQSGQSCIGVQRIMVHKKVYRIFTDKFVASARILKMGNPMDEGTFIGPMISEKEALRLESWINSAVDHGAKLLCGGKRDGAMLEPAVLENVPKNEMICAKEAFGPVVVISSFQDFDAALKEVNDSI
ncbi:hypothetical protein LCGC14_2092020, partial [marine sediment metagenome]